MGVSVLAAFVAGLVSFLSPCVLPLVPGYISMLSGIGVEQLKEGQTPRAGLLTSALAFVFGFSIVFITFGASASAVGSFLVRNRSLLAPLAGALIILFGLHLIGWLAKISLRAGFVIGIILIAVGVALTVRPGIAGATLKAVHFYSLAIIFLLGPAMTGWQNRDIHFATGGGQPGIIGGCGGAAGDGGDAGKHLAGNFPAGVLLRGARDSISRDRFGNRRFLEVLPALSPPLACGRGVQRCAIACCWRPCVREPIDMAFG